MFWCVTHRVAARSRTAHDEHRRPERYRHARRRNSGSVIEGPGEGFTGASAPPGLLGDSGAFEERQRFMSGGRFGSAGHEQLCG